MTKYPTTNRSRGSVPSGEAMQSPNATPGASCNAMSGLQGRNLGLWAQPGWRTYRCGWGLRTYGCCATTAWMQEVEQRRSSCRGTAKMMLINKSDRIKVEKLAATANVKAVDRQKMQGHSCRAEGVEK